MNKLLRSSFWLQSILPAVLSNLLIWVVVMQKKLTLSLSILLLLFIVSSIGFSGLGYLINDFFDQKEDLKSGKKNLTTNLSIVYLVLTILVLTSIAFVPWIFLPHSNLILALLLSQLGLYLLYNAPPFRLKKFPFLSTFIDASYAYLIPFLLAYLVFFSNSPSFKTLGLFVVGTILFLNVGIRNMLVHQFDDLKSDALIKRNSTVLFLGIEKSALLLFTLLGIEFILFLSFTYILSTHNISYLVAIPIFILISLNRIYVYRNKCKNAVSLSQLGIFTNSIYQFYIPILSILILVFTDNYLWIIALLLQFSLLTSKQFVLNIVKPNTLIKDLWYKKVQTIWFNVIRPFPGQIVNQIIYLIFLGFCVNLKKENKSAFDFLKDKLQKNKPEA